MDHHRYPNPRERRNATKWMCGVRPHVRIGQEDFGLLLVCLGSGGLFVFVWVCVKSWLKRLWGGGGYAIGTMID